MAPKQRKPSPYTEERLDAIAWILQRAVQKKGAVNPEVAMVAANLLPGWSATRDGTSYRFKAPKPFKFRGRELASIAIDKRGKPIDGPTFWTWYYKVGGHQDAMNLRAVTPPAVIERAQAGPKEREVYARIEAVPAIEEALRWGLVNRVVPAGELMTAARALAEEVAASAPLSLAVIKEILTANETRSIAEGYALYRSGELEIYERVLASEDAREGPLAFTEKRAPVWKGK